MREIDYKIVEIPIRAEVFTHPSRNDSYPIFEETIRKFQKEGWRCVGSVYIGMVRDESEQTMMASEDMKVTVIPYIKRKPPELTPQDIQLANYLSIKIKHVSEAKHTEAQKVKWANEFRLMREQDKRTFEQINLMIEWIFGNKFWSTIIRSAGSLRDKWNEGKLGGKRQSGNVGEF